METITGTIEKIDSKKTATGKDMFSIHMTGYTKQISGFGLAPIPLQEAQKNNQPICITYDVSEQGYWNYKNASPYEQKSESTDITDKVINECAEVMKKCREAVTKIIGHPPQTDGENAMTTSIFTEANKHLNTTSVINEAKR